MEEEEVEEEVQSRNSKSANQVSFQNMASWATRAILWMDGIDTLVGSLAVVALSHPPRSAFGSLAD